MCPDTRRRILGLGESAGIAARAAKEVNMSSIPIVLLTIIALAVIFLVVAAGAGALIAGALIAAIIVIVTRKQRRNAAPAVATAGIGGTLPLEPSGPLADNEATP
jgi:hypothetical protein